VAALCVLASGPVQAQVAGVYTGYSADGELVQLKVAALKTTGRLGIREAAVFVDAPCDYRTIDAVGGIVYGVGEEIRHGVVRAERAEAAAFDIRFSLTFAADGRSATGSIRSIIPGLDATRLGAEQALFCLSPDQPLQVSLMMPGAEPPPLPGRILYDWTRPMAHRP
jgi:hypothetical protein